MTTPGTYTYLDLTPLGRQEDWEQPAGSDGPFMSWVRRHDEYDAEVGNDPTRRAEAVS